MKFKSSVRIDNVTPECLFCIIRADHFFEDNKQVMFITSVTDGKHMAGSLHYSGKAFDVRYPYLYGEKRKAFIAYLKMALYPLCDVVPEKTHIHIEYQPKTK